MTEPPEGGCCKCMFSFTITSCFTALFMWLSLRVTKPTCSIEQFYVYTLNKTSNYQHTTNMNKNNHSIYYDLKLNNNNNDKGIFYDALNLTFYYKPNLTFPIGRDNHTSFHQGQGKSTHRLGDVVTSLNGRVVWEKSATEAVLKNGSAVFRVELETRVRFKIVFWKTKRRHLVVGADLVVNEQGSLVKRKKNKGIKLHSGVDGIIIKGCFKFKLLITLISVLILIDLL